MDVNKKLAEIQQKLKAPKNQFNKFGGFKYRNCEDILEAVKPLLGDCILILTDKIVEVGGRVYVQATAELIGEGSQSSAAYAREPESRKGMDESQITGAASSYARKYALNGLFCIDDTKDADSAEKAPIPEKPVVDIQVEPVMHFNALCKDKGLTEDEITDFQNWACTAKKEADFNKIVGSLVQNFDKAYPKWMETRL